MNDPSTTKHELEQAADYLGRHNFKTLVEWFTAEVILNRPKDPVSFLGDLIRDKVDSREGAPYVPTDAVRYAKDCYEEASSNADEEGQIHPRPYPRKPSSLTDSLAVRRRLETLEKVIKCSRNITQELDTDNATNVIIKETCSLLGCDRASLYVSCQDTQELELVVAKGAQSIRLPIGQGVAGTVAANGRICNIPDAYTDARFNSAHDEQSGYKTRTILAAPVVNAQGRTVGVIQALNKLVTERSCTDEALNNYDKPDEDKLVVGSVIPFNETDEDMIMMLAQQAGIALHNAEMFQQTVSSNAKINSMLEIIKALNSDLGINSLMFTITNRAHQLVEADRCTMFLLDHAAKELISLQGEVNLRIPMDKGIAGECCTTNQVINIVDAYGDNRFNKEVDKVSGYHTATILSMPCRGPEGNVVGVIQLINKSTGAFDEVDINIMETFLALAGPALAQSQLCTNQRAPKTGDDTIVGSSMERSGSQMREIRHQVAIEEGDEDEC